MFDLICVGGGVLGTFHAYHAAQKGLKVAIVERHEKPIGATVRNFGQVVPSGMNSKWQKYGRESLKYYKEIQAEFDISVRQNGSIYIASNEEELNLLEELAAINTANDYPSVLFTKEKCLSHYPNLKSDYVVGGLYFPEEVTVEPDKMIYLMHDYLKKEKSVEIIYASTVFEVHQASHFVQIDLVGGKKLNAKKLVICSGDEFRILYPEIFENSDLELTKLQMMKTVPQRNVHLNGSILTGLSIRRYEAFAECPSYISVKEKEDPNSFHKKWGVHILFKQAVDGSVIIGDSHEYTTISNRENLGFELSQEINQYMLDEAKKIVNLDSYEIASTWYGIYSQCKNSDIFNHKVSEDITIITGIGGKGMTGSAGYSKEQIERIFN